MKKKVILLIGISLGVVSFFFVGSVFWCPSLASWFPSPLRNFACVYSDRYAEFQENRAGVQAKEFECNARTDTRFVNVRLWSACDTTEIGCSGHPMRLTERVVVIRIQGTVETATDLNALKERAEQYGLDFPIEFSVKIEDKTERGSNN